MNKEVNEQEIIQVYKTLREEVALLKREFLKTSQELKEHRKIIAVMEDMADDRNCYRITGNQLLQGTAKEIKDHLTCNVAKFEVLTRQLEQNLEKKLIEHDEHVQKHNIRVVSEEEARQLQRQQQMQKQQPPAQKA
uniref:Prefoldin subunit 6 n=1 Tax=Rhabditophanes sp. KR3021 TaxID=114890 RepID=A0AC35TH44_9BILA